MRPEYKRSDFGDMVRGKYAKRIRESTNVIVLDPEVAKAFPDDEAVNKALRGLISHSFIRTGEITPQDKKDTCEASRRLRRVVARSTEWALEHRSELKDFAIRSAAL